jgi:hypothetical protein
MGLCSDQLRSDEEATLLSVFISALEPAALSSRIKWSWTLSSSLPHKVRATRRYVRRSNVITEPALLSDFLLSIPSTNSSIYVGIGIFSENWQQSTTFSYYHSRLVC